MKKSQSSVGHRSSHYSNGLLASSPSLVLERIFSRIRVVLACCGGQVIVRNSEFCDGENAVQHLSRPKSTRKFR